MDFDFSFGSFLYLIEWFGFSALPTETRTPLPTLEPIAG